MNTLQALFIFMCVCVGISTTHPYNYKLQVSKDCLQQKLRFPTVVLTLTYTLPYEHSTNNLTGIMFSKHFTASSSTFEACSTTIHLTYSRGMLSQVVESLL